MINKVWELLPYWFLSRRRTHASPPEDGADRLNHTGTWLLAAAGHSHC